MSNRGRASESAGRVPVYGITEFECWYCSYDLDLPALRFPVEEPRRAVTDCIDAHRAVGVDHLVWECGRSLVSYRSDLQQTSWGSPGGGHMPPLGALCPLREALTYGHAHGVRVLGRLCMNRHYGPSTPDKQSQFVRDNPGFVERMRTGGAIVHRLCYGVEAVQQERLDVLLEIQRIGVDGLVLDYCRQMPILGYHEALVAPYRARTGVDPRLLRSTRPEDYADWFQFRADVLTGFMRRLRSEVRRQEQKLGRACPIVVRVPDAAAWLMIAYGLDTAAWCAGDLVDGLMLSPFPRTLEDTSSCPAYQAEIAHAHGKFCVGGLGALNLYRPKGQGGTLENTGFFHPKPAYRKVARQYRAGCDAMSLYQSEILVRLPYLSDLVRDLGCPDAVTDQAESLPDPDRQVLFRANSSEGSIGLDWHAAWCPPVYRKGESLSPEISDSGGGWSVAL